MSGSPARALTSSTDSGTSTILVVARQTGLSMDTLRVWERRYGFPRPERRPGSNRRLYARADVERLQAIRRALDRGFRVGDVIGKPLAELAALAGDAPAPADVATSPDPRAVPSLLELLRRDEVPRLEGELRRASVALGPRAFVRGLAQPFAVAVGAAWAAGDIGVHHEHVATECLATRLRAMLAGYQDVEGRPHVLLTTLPGELHGLALLMIALDLAVSGARPRLLGPSTPPREIALAARACRADAVGVGVSAAAPTKEARAALRELGRALPASTPIWVGGGGAARVAGALRRPRVVRSWAELDELLARTHGGESRSSAAGPPSSRVPPAPGARRDLRGDLEPRRKP